MALGSKKETKRKFVFRPATQEQMRQRSVPRSSRDSFIRDDVMLFVPHDKKNRIRYLPQTYSEEPAPYSVDIYVHYGIGENNSYLCAYKMKQEPCPLCEARNLALEEGDEETADSLKPTLRALAWVIDRNKEEEGPKAWAAAQSLDSSICAISNDEDTGEIIHIEDIEKGHDVLFSKSGTGKSTKYDGEKIATKASPLHADPQTVDKWLDFVMDNPLTDILVWHDYDYIKSIFEGKLATKQQPKEEENEEKPVKAKISTKKKVEKEPEPEEEQEKEPEPEEEEEEGVTMTWEEVHELDEGDLKEILESAGIPEEDYEDMSTKELADEICKMYEIEEPKKEEKPGKMSLKDRLKAKKAGK